MRKHRVVLPLLITCLLLQACGQEKLNHEGAGSFASATAVEDRVSDGGATAGGLPEEGESAADLSDRPATKAEPEREADHAEAGNASGRTAGGAEGRGAANSDVVGPKTLNEKKEVQAPSAGENGSSANESAKTEAKPAGKPTPAKPKPAAATADAGAKSDPVDHSAGKPAKSSSAGDKPGKTAQSGVTQIGWSEFFDGEDQTTPSDRFWDLSGSTVTIKGFMGEVLSFDKNWFLLIPEPGAECPFDNGDETYWNKIMIVFVPDDVKLRYKSEALQITGRLDVGIKIDESGYKTMFRLYDASFKEVKE